MGGQIIDATVVEARKPRLTRDEKATLRGGGMPSGWSKARTRRIDRDGRWTLKRGRKQLPVEGAPRQGEIAVPVFGYKNHIGIDRRYGFVRRFAVTHAARHDGSQLAIVLDGANTASDVWADTAYRSRANLVLIEKRGLVAQSSTRSRAASQCRRISPAATPQGPGCAAGSNTFSPHRSNACGSWCAPLVWTERRRRSRWPISPTTSPGSPGSKRELRRHDQ